jgi:hypothetical protein
MSATAVENGGLIGRTTDKRSEQEKAAVLYAAHGWPVLPGSTWNGRRYVVPATLKVTDGLRPWVARNLASSDVGTVARWWSADTRLAPSVLLLTGGAFNLVSVAFELAQDVLATTTFLNNAGPVMYRPDEGRAYFLVQPGPTQFDDLDIAPGEVANVAPGEWVAAPPTRTGNGVNVRWWSTPESVNWRLTDVAVFSEALAVACRDRADPSTR